MPYVPQDVLDRLSTLEREVRQLRGRAQIRPALNTISNGTVTIGEGGQLFVREPGGNLIFGAGQSRQGDWATSLAREGGTDALTVGGNVDPQSKQMIRIWARDRDAPDRVLVMDDAFSGRFLGRPSMPIPMQSTAGQRTSSTSTVTAWTGSSRLMNAVLWAAFETYTPAGTTADVQFEDSNGVVESWVATASNGWTVREITKPVRQNFMSHVNYRLRHSVRSGTGSIETNCLGVYTRNAFSASEAP
ncbi:hypothetical protein ACFXP3_14040 [Streptomyces sp. NPDC059096]|uniref:hypothetical protein n=1 Tax=Streptomyces sp. NPDC059096 TaxID=3346727 RepID=UPI0036990DF6